MGQYRRLIFDAFRRYSSDALRGYSWKNGWNPKEKAGLVSRSSSNNNINALRPLPGFWKKARSRYVPIIAVSGLVVSSLVSQFIRYSFSETVPYSKRKRVMLLDWDTEKESGNHRFEERKASYGNKVLLPNHPESIRIRRIGQNIVDEALQRGLKTHQLSDENIKHLEGLDWEFIVVDEPINNAIAYCERAGKVVVFSEHLKLVESDAEIAWVLGHEVAHAIARHPAEDFSRFMLFLVRTMFLPLLLPVELLYKIYNDIHLLRLRFLRRLELEADYIGMLLMASAGYDPRVSLLINKRYAEIEGKWTIWKSIFSTHPSQEKIVQFLSRPKVLKEAMCLYREAQLRQGISSAISKASSVEKCINFCLLANSIILVIVFLSKRW